MRMKNTPNPDLETALSHLRNLKDSVLPQLQKETKRKGYKLEIRQWDRNPGYDIFQGNYTHCCIAVEASNRGAIRTKEIFLRGFIVNFAIGNFGIYFVQALQEQRKAASEKLTGKLRVP